MKLLDSENLHAPAPCTGNISAVNEQNLLFKILFNATISQYENIISTIHICLMHRTKSISSMSHIHRNHVLILNVIHNMPKLPGYWLSDTGIG